MQKIVRLIYKSVNVIGLKGLFILISKLFFIYNSFFVMTSIIEHMMKHQYHCLLTEIECDRTNSLRLKSDLINRLPL